MKNISKYHCYYTDEDLKIIKEYAGIKSSAELAIILNRTQCSVLNFARKNNISLRLKGENHRAAKLSNLQTEMIKVLDASGFSPKEIHQAAFDHVSYSAVHAVVSGRTWSHA